MTEVQPLTDSLYDASIVLDGRQPLVPGTEEYDRLYVERPRVETDLMREAARAALSGRPFHWFFTGHTGSGKSTELNRIMNDDEIDSYLPVYVDLQKEFDVRNIQYTDLFLAMARACAIRADELSCPVSEELKKRIDRWGSEVFTEEELHTRTEGRAGLKVSVPFLALGEEVRSGGGKRDVIRTKIDTDVIEFTRLIDELAEALERYTGKRLLCVLDGLDHVTDIEHAQEVLDDHYQTLIQPRISKVIVIPLELINTPFLARCDGQYSTVPNIKILRQSDSDQLDENGSRFYREVISRYASLELFSSEALDSLCLLSAGIVREMIRNTGNACSYAAQAGASRVEGEHAEEVWYEVMRFYTNQLSSADYATLNKVQQQPLLEEGIDGVPPLLRNKAIVFYPNGRGWYGIHPAVQRMMREAASRGR